MYTEKERKEINWGLVIKRSIVALGIILLILVLIWLIGKVNSQSNNKAEDNTKTVDKTESKSLETYSKEFIENIRYMQETGRNYWNIAGELPTDGNSIRLSLQDLIDKGLLLPFSDKNGKACDQEVSYVKLTNNGGKYVMSVKLSCDSETATVTETLGCNQFCDGKCVKLETKKTEATKTKVTQYEYKQAYNSCDSNTSCPSGYTLSNGKCYKTKEVAAIKTLVNLDKTTTATKEENKSCSSGYLSGDYCYTSYTDTAYASCDAGYTRSGNRCVKTGTSTVNAIANTRTTCPSGYEVSGTRCVKRVKKTTDIVQKYTYTCGSGYKSSGSGASMTCYKYTTKEGKKYLETYQNLGKSCTYLGRKAKENCTTNCNKKYYTYYCTKSVKVTADPIKKLSNSTCPDGYTKSGNTCYKYVNSYTDGTNHTTYSCSDSSYTLNGSKCTKNTKITKDLSCPSGYSLSGGTCYHYSDNRHRATVTVSYTCPSGYKKDSKDQTKCILNGGNNYYKYTCGKGQFRTGSGENTKCYIKNGDVVNASKNTGSCTTKYKYTWSSNKSMAGWTATGKTRTVNK